MSGISGPDGINPANNDGRKTLKNVSASAAKFVSFGGFHNPVKNAPSGNMETRLSPTVLEQFQNLCLKYSSVEFQDYPEDERIPQLVIGDDYIEDVPSQECEV